MKKKIVIISGGMDSVTLLHDVVHKFGSKNIIALSFYYGSKHNPKELPMANKNCELLQVQHEIIDVQSIFDTFDSALLAHKDSEEIPEGYYADKNMKKTVVPFRNGILLSMAIGFAESKDCDTVYYGAHAGDHDIYPDCRKTFIDSISNAAKYGTYNNIEIIAPYWEGNKYQILEIGKRLGVDYSKTWTCYNPNSEDDIPCGKCGSCVERAEAFYNHQIADPLYPLEIWKDVVLNMLELKKANKK